MNKNARGLNWLLGGLIAVSMLGACGVPVDDETASEQLDSQSAGEVAVGLSVPSHTLSVHEAVEVTVTLTNVSAQPVRLLKWYVPGDGLKNSMFEVAYNGEAVKYIGPHYKRLAPRTEDYITLNPGESLSGPVNLSNMYDLSKSGTYSIRYDVGSMHLHGTALTKVATLESNDVNLWIEGRPSQRPNLQALGTVSSQGFTYYSCTANQQYLIYEAMNYAASYANESSNYLNSLTTPTQRYVTWFGPGTNANLYTLRNNFNNLRSAFATGSIVIDCTTCKDSSLAAYVPNPGSSYPFRINLCPGLWDGPIEGADSYAGVLIHEMSHFYAVAATDDWVYGQSGSMYLARYNTPAALDNADNYHYFAANSPYLP